MKRAYRAFNIYQLHGFTCVYHSTLDHLLIQYSDRIFGHYALNDFEKVNGEYGEQRWVSLENVNYYQPHFISNYDHVFESWEGQSPILSGNWDRYRSKLNETVFYKSLEKHFHDGVPWEDTIFIQRRMDEIAEGSGSWGVNTRSELKKKCKRTEQLYESIKQQGFLAPSELDQAHDIFVNVSRNGSYIAMGGRHRLVLASLLDTPKIPVRVSVRHSIYHN